MSQDYVYVGRVLDQTLKTHDGLIQNTIRFFWTFDQPHKWQSPIPGDYPTSCLLSMGRRINTKSPKPESAPEFPDGMVILISTDNHVWLSRELNEKLENRYWVTGIPETFSLDIVESTARELGLGHQRDRERVLRSESEPEQGRRSRRGRSRSR